MQFSYLLPGQSSLAVHSTKEIIVMMWIFHIEQHWIFHIQSIVNNNNLLDFGATQKQLKCLNKNAYSAL